MTAASEIPIGSDTRTLPFLMGDDFPKGPVVYFIAAVGKIKIGQTNDLQARFQSLRSNSLVELTILGWIEGGRDFERVLHASLKSHRVNGEWFSDCPEVRGALAKSNELGLSGPPRRSVDANVEWAAVALRTLAGARAPDDSIRNIVRRAANVVGFSYWRTFDLWYRKARRLEPTERDAINRALAWERRP